MRGEYGSDVPPPFSNVINLSSIFRLDRAESSILEKGLTFIPTPGVPRRSELRRDLHMYHRRLKLLDYFGYNNSEEVIPFVKSSSWEPEEDSVSLPIRTLIRRDVEAFNRHKFKPNVYNNISQEERKALSKLAANPNIIIKSADKGGQICIQDRDNYLKEAYRQLNDAQYYKPLLQPLQNETQAIVRTKVDKLYQDGFINRKQKTYLMGPDSPRPRLFYLLPKIHKAPASWPVPCVVPSGRPIVSDCGSETYNVAEFIDYYLNPLSRQHPSYIKDTYDFVNKLKTIRAPKHTFIFSIDVESLYTNIDTDLGLKAVADVLSTKPDPSRPDHFILELLELTLRRNDFEFNGKHFLQISGCAMGRKYSPAYADIYMADWEKSAFQKCSKLPLLYLRYLDDIFGLWPHSLSDFKEFIKTLNNHHPKISLQYNLQQFKVEFLDTQVFFSNFDSETKGLATKVHFKETDRHALLFKTSYHPRHTYRGLIKSQLIRFHRICTYKEDVEIATRILFTALKPRGYTCRFLRRIKSEVNRLFESSGEYTSNNNNMPVISFVVTYSQQLVQLNSALKTNFNQAQSEIEELREFKMITAYRRNKNLKDILVHTNLKNKIQAPKIKNAKFIHVQYLDNIHSQRGCPVWGSFTEDTSNLVYAIQCTTCKKIYIGETGNRLRVRMYQHTYHLRRANKPTVLYSHLRTHGSDGYKFMILESNSGWSRVERQRRERHWISKLKTIDPWGLNEKH